MGLVKPKIITADQIGLNFVDVGFGQLGPERYVTGHHTAGVRDRSDQHAVELAREYHREHKAKGWGGIGYHFMISRRGTLICLRPTVMKGAHVGGWNTSNIGVVFNGTTGDKPSRRQMRTLRWLLRNAHTRSVPIRHRTDLDLGAATRRGHRDWRGHETNACPGTHYVLIHSGGRRR